MSAMRLRRHLQSSDWRTHVAGLLVLVAALLALHHGAPMVMGDDHSGMSDAGKEMVVCLAVVGLGAAVALTAKQGFLRRRLWISAAGLPHRRSLPPRTLASPARAGPLKLQVLRL